MIQAIVLSLFIGSGTTPQDSVRPKVCVDYQVSSCKDLSDYSLSELQANNYQGQVQILCDQATFDAIQSDPTYQILSWNLQ